MAVNGIGTFVVAEFCRLRSLSDLLKLKRQNRIPFANLTERVEFNLQLGYKAISERAINHGAAITALFDALSLSANLGIEPRRKAQETAAALLAALGGQLMNGGKQETQKELVKKILAADLENIESLSLIFLMNSISEKFGWEASRIDRLLEINRKYLALAQKEADSFHLWAAASHFTFFLRKTSRYFGRPVDAAEARRCAEIAVQSFSATPSDRKEKIEVLKDLEIIHTLLVDLRHFGFYDLMEEYISRNELDKKDQGIADLMRLIRSRDHLTAAECIRLINESNPSDASLIEEEASIVLIEIAVRELTNRSLPWSGPAKPALVDRRDPENIPRELKKEIKKLLSLALNWINGRIPSKSFVFRAGEYEGWNLYFFKPHPARGKFTLFLCQGLEIYRINFSREKSGKEWEIDPPSFNKLAAINLLGCVWEFPQEERFSSKLNRLIRALELADLRDFLKDIRRDYGALEREISQDPELVNLHDLALKNIAQTQNLFSRFVGDYPVSEILQISDCDNPLRKHIPEIILVPPARVEKFLKEEILEKIAPFLPKRGGRGGFPWLIALKGNGGRRLYLVLRDFETVSLLGENEKIGGLTSDFIRELVYSSLIKLWGKENKLIGENNVASYLIADNPLEILTRRNMTVEHLYETAFKKLIGEKGVLFFDFFTLEKDGAGKEFYRPLEDQSPEAKKRALNETGPERLYISREPWGRIVRLPVRKKNDGYLGVGAFQPSQEALQQQALLGDDRPLPVKFALYLLTGFKNRPDFTHVFLLALKNSEEEVLDPELISAFEAEVRSGKYKNPDTMIKHSPKEQRELLARLLADETNIEQQAVEPFEVYYTFQRMRFLNVAQLLRDGHRL